jgi:D-sedoheptulose 7-phosphate isomerase
MPVLRTDPRAVLVACLRESIDLKTAVLGDEALLAEAAQVAVLVAAALRAGNQVLLFGNGGSAADAMHVAAELVGRFKAERAALPALSLSDNVSSLTAIANDFAYERVFARQIEAFGRPGDVAIALTTSGLSKNIIRGLEVAAARGLRTVAFTGASGGDCVRMAEVCLRVPSTDTARIQECTVLVCHAICEWVEQQVLDG